MALNALKKGVLAGLDPVFLKASKAKKEEESQGTYAASAMQSEGNDDSALAYLAKQAQAQQQARQLALNGATAQYEAQSKALAAQREEDARGVYVRREQAARALPQHLAKSGLTGGVAESAALALEARYGREMAALDKEYRTARAKLETALSDLRLKDARQAALDEAATYKAMATAAKSAAKTTAKATTTQAAEKAPGETSTTVPAALKSSTFTLPASQENGAGGTADADANRQRLASALRRRAERAYSLLNLGLTDEEIARILRAEGYGN